LIAAFLPLFSFLVMYVGIRREVRDNTAGNLGDGASKRNQDTIQGDSPDSCDERIRDETLQLAKRSQRAA
jgi:hypothetical protein